MIFFKPALKAVACSVALLSVSMASVSANAAGETKSPIQLSDMGSFMFAGSVKSASDGETFHGDHGYAQYFIPVHSHSLPVVMWHGGGQSGKSWESTPDGRDGFWQIFTRAGWPVFIIDQPRRGRAGRTDVADSSSQIPTDNKESMAWNTFRLGTWVPPGKPQAFKNTAFPQGPYSLEQFMRWQTPNTGPEPFPDAGERHFQGQAVADLFKKIGPGILMTHSQSGQYGWETAMQIPELVKAVVAFEPGAYAFPEGDLPPDVPTKISFVASGTAPQVVSDARFKNLTRMPIVIYFGDNITDKPSSVFGVEVWRVIKIRAQQFVDTVNRHGGHATLIDLPSMGIHGNTHFIFADKNNAQIATMTQQYLEKQHLAGSDKSYVIPESVSK
ncbi:alpha/beta hydrolase [Raoultella terrigena]|uniref:alpha/beta hydrolase n=1 Tax=Raoultella terrigena TaxID=577 RepID=UPI000978082E|nr:alpha/beta fold hydrolase [Raoultella terrigena]OMP91108.1 hypothetical protein BZP36_22265 [Raoultella terrigena]